MKTKKGEKEKLRQTILEKAIAYFKKNGAGGTGTESVMKHMGLTRGALYSHFKSKEDLFATAVAEDLKKLEESLELRFLKEPTSALENIIKDHLSEKNLTDVGNSCAFTSLSSEMQRCKASHRALYEASMLRIYKMFAEALSRHFPKDNPQQSLTKAYNLYSGLVGTLTMARTIKDPVRAREILRSGREHLVDSFSP
ncbi:MAG: TetR/AcrR family transcriptional regulator [Bdellovibrionales bacterium]|nr:TetR/AcrR family transcriptional regulator [Bdellovibrionales bacterium]